jgi:hypothetical protein
MRRLRSVVVTATFNCSVSFLRGADTYMEVLLSVVVTAPWNSLMSVVVTAD